MLRIEELSQRVESSFFVLTQPMQCPNQGTMLEWLFALGGQVLNEAQTTGRLCKSQQKAGNQHKTNRDPQH